MCGGPGEIVARLKALAGEAEACGGVKRQMTGTANAKRGEIEFDRGKTATTEVGDGPVAQIIFTEGAVVWEQQIPKPLPAFFEHGVMLTGGNFFVKQTNQLVSGNESQYNADEFKNLKIMTL